MKTEGGDVEFVIPTITVVDSDKSLEDQLRTEVILYRPPNDSSTLSEVSAPKKGKKKIISGKVKLATLDEFSQRLNRTSTSRRPDKDVGKPRKDNAKPGDRKQVSDPSKPVGDKPRPDKKFNRNDSVDGLVKRTGRTSLNDVHADIFRRKPSDKRPPRTGKINRQDSTNMRTRSRSQESVTSDFKLRRGKWTSQEALKGSKENWLLGDNHNDESDHMNKQRKEHFSNHRKTERVSRKNSVLVEQKKEEEVENIFAANRRRTTWLNKGKSKSYGKLLNNPDREEAKSEITDRSDVDDDDHEEDEDALVDGDQEVGEMEGIIQKNLVKLDNLEELAQPPEAKTEILATALTRAAPTGKQLKPEDMEFCKRHTRFDEKTISRWFKSFRKECPNGKLTRGHMLDLFKKVFPAGNGEAFCNHIFRIFDSDGNNFLDFKEFLMALDIAQGRDEKEKLEWAFRIYDVDDSGSINLLEMTNIIATMDELEGEGGRVGKDSPGARAREVFSSLDVDGDGSLTLKEFVSGYLRLQESDD